MKKLQIGDKIYATNNSCVSDILEIARITPTLGITLDGTKFKINTTDDGFCQKTSKDDPWTFRGKCYYQLETPELKEILQKQRLAQKLSKFNFNKLDLKTLIEINSKLTEIKN
jgi:hypothetical protein